MDFQLESPDSSTKKRGARPAPEELTPTEVLSLEEWAEKKMPWISRGALGSTTTLEDYIDECLDWYRAKGRRQADWVATVRGWIRRDEKRRLTSPPSDYNKSALRDPQKWKQIFDRGERAEKATEGLRLVVPSREQQGTSSTLSARRN